MINPEALLNKMIDELEHEGAPEDPEKAQELREMQLGLERLKGVPMTPLNVASYTYMMVFYESDLGILNSVLINMLSAGVAMLLASFLNSPSTFLPEK